MGNKKATPLDRTPAYNISFPNMVLIILSQFLNEIKITGIVLILFAVIFSQLAPLYDKKKYGRV